MFDATSVTFRAVGASLSRTLAREGTSFVFGTVVDWHGSIVRELQALHPAVDGDALALAWRSGY